MFHGYSWIIWFLLVLLCSFSCHATFGHLPMTSGHFSRLYYTYCKWFDCTKCTRLLHQSIISINRDRDLPVNRKLIMWSASKCFFDQYNIYNITELMFLHPCCTAQDLDSLSLACFGGGSLSRYLLQVSRPDIRSAWLDPAHPGPRHPSTRPVILYLP